MGTNGPIQLSSRLRAVHDRDAAGLADLIGAAFAEYPGCVLDLDGLDGDLRRPVEAAGAAAARWWVLPDASDDLAATVRASAPGDGEVELERLYVAASARGCGLGTALVRWVEAHALGLGASRVGLWSDTRFAAAHRLYHRLGYRDTGATRELHDPSNTVERRFVTDLPAAASHAPCRGERCEHPLPDGQRRHGRVAGITYDLELDGAGGVRRFDVAADGRHLRCGADGTGRWWVDGTRRPDLDGAGAVLLAPSGADRPVPIGGPGTRHVLWIRAESLDVGIGPVPTGDAAAP